MKNNGRYTDLVTPVNFSSVQFSSFDVNEALGLFVSVLVAKWLLPSFDGTLQFLSRCVVRKRTAVQRIRYERTLSADYI